MQKLDYSVRALLSGDDSKTVAKRKRYTKTLLAIYDGKDSLEKLLDMDRLLISEVKGWRRKLAKDPDFDPKLKAWQTVARQFVPPSTRNWRELPVEPPMHDPLYREELIKRVKTRKLENETLYADQIAELKKAGLIDDRYDWQDDLLKHEEKYGDRREYYSLDHGDPEHETWDELPDEEIPDDDLDRLMDNVPSVPRQATLLTEAPKEPIHG